jgi:hypothetical protein
MKSNTQIMEAGHSCPARSFGTWRTGVSALFIALAGIAFAQEPEERVVLIPWGKVPKADPKEAPLFFNATAEVKAAAGLKELTSVQQVSFKVQQGKPECLSLGLSGPGEVLEVAGAGLRDWSVRVGDQGARFLDIRPILTDEKMPEGFQVTVKTRAKVENGGAGLLLPAPGSATGYSLAVTVEPGEGADIKVLRADGMVPVASEDSPLPKGRRPVKYVSGTVSMIELAITPEDADAVDLEIVNAALRGKPAQDGASVSFRLTGVARARKDKAAIALLGGGAALSGAVSGDGWHLALRRSGDKWVYDLVAEQAGDLPVDLTFEVPTRPRGDWKQVGFELPAGVIVPVALEGLGKSVEFDSALAVVPESRGAIGQRIAAPDDRGGPARAPGEDRRACIRSNG